MTDEQAKAIADSIVGHGNQLGSNLVHLKAFTAAQNEQQQKFLEGLQAENARLQAEALKAARMSAIAALMSAIATVAGVVAAFMQAT